MTGINLVFILLVFSIGVALQMYFYRSLLLKLMVITMMFMISSIAYFSLESYKGWPTVDSIEDGTLIAVKVEEPRDGFKGAIYLWVTPDEQEKTITEKIFSYSVDIAPRSYQIQYSEQTADEFLDANEKIKKGFIVKVTKKGKQGSSDSSNGTGEGNSDNGNGSSNTAVASGNRGDAENYNVPSLTIISPEEILRK